MPSTIRFFNNVSKRKKEERSFIDHSPFLRYNYKSIKYSVNCKFQNYKRETHKTSPFNVLETFRKTTLLG